MAWRNLENPWRRANLALALEPRIMFDAAGAATYADLGDPDPTPVPPPIEEPPREVVFVDRAVAAHDHLVAHVREGVEIVVLSTETDALDQIAAALQGRSGFAAIHIVSHGSEGQLILGGRAFDAAALSSRADTLAAIGAALAQDGDILLYGCEIARGDTGLAFLGTLASLTGADIAASIDHTGNAAFGGNWTLEAQVGAVTASLAFTIEGQGGYGFLLASSYTIGDVSSFPIAQISSRILVGDFDGDGDADFLFQTGGNGTAIQFARNDGGTFTIFEQWESPFASVTLPDFGGNGYFAADLTGNGRLDVLITRSGAAPLLLRNDGATFALENTTGGPQSSAVGRFVVADFTGNGRADILYQEGASGAPLRFATYNGDGTFTIASDAGPFAGLGAFDLIANSFAAGDFNGDGRIDLYVGRANASGLLFLNDGNSFSLASGWNTPTTQISSRFVAADFTGNGRPDILYHVGGASSEIRFARNDGNTFTDLDFSASPFAGSGLVNFTNSSSYVGDFDGDGDLDLFVALPNAAGSVFLRNGAPPTLVSSSPADDANAVAPGANISLTFSEAIFSGGGSIQIVRSSDNVVVETIATNSARVTGLGTATVTIDPVNDLAPGVTYHIRFDANAFRDADGNNFARYTPDFRVQRGIDDPNFLNFTTIANTPPALAGTPANPTIDDTATATPFSALSFTDAESNGGTITITYTAANGTLSGTGLTGSAGNYTLSGANPAELTARLQALVFTPTQNQVTPGQTVATTFTLTPNDGTVNGPAVTAQVTATSVNDTPQLGLPGAPIPLFDTATLTPFATATIVDPDPGQTITVTVTLDVAAKGTLAGGGFAHQGNGVYTFSAASPAVAEAALRALVFTPTANRLAGGVTEPATFNVAVRDGPLGAPGTAISAGNVRVDVTGVNDAPTMTPNFTLALDGTDENTPSVAATVSTILTMASFVDPDPGTQIGMAVTAATGNGTWQFSLDGTNWTDFGTVSGGSALLLSGSTQVRFAPDGIVGGPAGFTFRAWDGTSGTASAANTPRFADTSTSGGTTAFSVQTGTVSVAVTDINDAPTLAATGANPTFTEGGTAAALFSAVTISTVEPGQTIVALTLTVSGVVDGTAERLFIGGQVLTLTDGTTLALTGGGTASVSVAAGVATVSITGLTRSPAQAETLVQSLAYENASNNPTVGDGRTVTLVSIRDSGGTANGGQDTTTVSIASAVTLVAVNNAPVLGQTSFALPPTDEDTPVLTTVSAITTGLALADPDGPGRGIAVIGSSGLGLWQFSVDAGNTWNSLGFVGPGNALLLSDPVQIRYLPNGIQGETATLTVRGWDRSSGVVGDRVDATTVGTATTFSTQVGNVTLAVAAINDAPVLAGTVGGTFTETVLNAAPGQSSGGTVLLAAGVVMTDPDAPANFAGARLGVAFVEYQTGDLISFASSFAGYTYAIVGGEGQIRDSGNTLVATVVGGFQDDLVVTFTAAATGTVVNDVIRNVLFTHLGNDPTAGGTATTRAIELAFEDGGNTGAGGPLLSNVLTGTLTIVALNDPEGFAGTIAPTFTERAGPVLVAPGATVTRVDAPNFVGGSLTVALGAFSGGDVLSITQTGGITVSGGVVSFEGNVIGTFVGGAGGNLVVTFVEPEANHAAVQALVRAIAFENTSPNPTDFGAATTRAVTMTLDDGGNTGTGGAQTSTLTGTITIAAVNDAPVLTPSAGNTAFIPGAGPVVIDPGFVLTDVDSQQLNRAVMILSATPNGFAESITLAGDAFDLLQASNLSATFTSVPMRALVIEGLASLAVYQALLRGVVYDNTAASPDTTPRTISFVVRDAGGAESDAVTRTIILNSPPTVAIGTLPSVAEGASVILTPAMVTASDVETTDPAQLVFAITAVTNGTVRLDGTALVVGGTFTQADVNAGRITYLHDGSETLTGGFSFVVRDADDVASPAQTLAFTIDPVNDAPTITFTSALSSLEDVPTPLTGIVFADPDAGAQAVVATFTVARGTLAAISGGGVSVVGSGTGTLVLTGSIASLNAFVAASSVVFTTAANDGQDVQLTVTIDDQGNSGAGGPLTDFAAITITVTPVNDAPVIGGVSATPGTIEAGTGPAPIAPLAAITVADVDTPVFDGGRIEVAQTSGLANGTFSRGGTVFTFGDAVLVDGTAIGAVTSDGRDGASLRIDLGNGATLARVEAFLRSLAYAAPIGAGDRVFALTLVDGAGSANGGADTATASFTIAVTPSTPVIAGLTGAFTYLEKSGPVLLGTAVPGAVLVTDLDSPNFAGGELRVAITGGTAAEDRLAFLETGGVSIAGGTVSVGGVAIGTLTGGTGGADLVVTLGSEANAARLTALLATLAYENTNQANPVEGARTVTVTLRDAAPGPDARTSDPAQIVLTVQGVNDAPVIGGIDPAPQAIADTGTVQPFTGATIVDVDGAGVTLTTTVTIAQPAQGSFAPASLGGFVDLGGGLYRFVGTQADAQAALRGLVFVPAENRVAPGSSETTSLVVGVSDGIAAPVTASATIVATSINDAPTLAPLPNLQALNDKSTLAPFGGAVVVDPDVGQPLTLTVTIGQPAHGGFTAASLAATGFAATGVPGVFALVAPDAAAAQAALRGLVFQPVENRIPPGTTETTSFTVSVSDGVAPAVEQMASVVVTSINDAPVVGGLRPGQSVAHDATLLPFAGMLVADPDTGQTFSVRIGLTNAGVGGLTGASLAAAGFVEIGPGLYERNGLSDAAAAAAALRGLVFQPTPNAVAPGTTASVAITISVSDGSASTTSTGTVTIVGPRLDAPIPVPPPPPVAPPPPPAPPPVAPPPIIFVPGPPIGGPVQGPVQGPTLGGGLAPILASDGGGPVAAPSFSPISATSGFFLAPSDGASLGIAIRASAPVGDFVLRSGGGSASFTLPPSTFVVETAGAQVLVGALLADGSPLPAWVQFDPATGTFRVDVPPGFTGTLDIVLTATLASGESATTGFSIEVESQSEPATPQNEPSQEAPPQRQGSAPAAEPVRLVAEGGKPAFSDAVKAASRGAWATHAQTLLDDLIVTLPGERPSGEIEAESRNGRDAA